MAQGNSARNVQDVRCAQEHRLDHLRAQRCFVAGRHGLFEPHILDARKRALVQALVIARLEERLGRHNVNRLHARHARKQIEVRRPQAATVRRLIRHRDDNTAIERVR